jgi:hypothetical protein
MLAKLRPARLGMFALLLIALCGGWAAPARAQGSEDTFFEDQDFFPDEDPFQETDEFGVPQDDFTEGGEFIDESTVEGEEITAEGRQAQLRLLGERELLPTNAAWGAGTGLLIGGWFALINQGTSRETQRSLGLGVVLGTLVGLAVGARTLFSPSAAQPISATDLNPLHDSAERDNQAFAASSLFNSPIQLSVTFRF